MLGVACALQEVRRGWRALQAGFPCPALVHVDCAGVYLGRVDPRAASAVKTWRLVDQLAAAVHAALTGNADGSSALCTCVDNRDGRHRHGPAGCLVVGCDCKAAS